MTITKLDLTRHLLDTVGLTAKDCAALVGMITEGKSARWKVLHSSEDVTWQTPPEVWQGVLDRFGLKQFDLD